MVEHQEGDLSTVPNPCLTAGARGPSPTLGLPALDSSVRKRSPCKIWLWKSVRILAIQVRWEAAGNPDFFLKSSPTDSLTLKHLPWALLEGQQLRKCQRHTRKDVWLQGEGWMDISRCLFVEPSSHAASR